MQLRQVHAEAIHRERSKTFKQFLRWVNAGGNSGWSAEFGKQIGLMNECWLVKGILIFGYLFLFAKRWPFFKPPVKDKKRYNHEMVEKNKMAAAEPTL